MLKKVWKRSGKLPSKIGLSSVPSKCNVLLSVYKLSFSKISLLLDGLSMILQGSYFKSSWDMNKLYVQFIFASH